MRNLKDIIIRGGAADCEENSSVFSTAVEKFKVKLLVVPPTRYSLRRKFTLELLTHRATETCRNNGFVVVLSIVYYIEFGQLLPILDF